MEHDTFTLLKEYTSSTEAEIAKTVLESVGIHAEVQNEFMSNIYPGVVPSQLMVRTSDAERAEQVLSQHQ